MSIKKEHFQEIRNNVYKAITHLCEGNITKTAYFLGYTLSSMDTMMRDFEKNEPKLTCAVIDNEDIEKEMKKMPKI